MKIDKLYTIKLANIGDFMAAIEGEYVQIPNEVFCNVCNFIASYYQRSFFQDILQIGVDRKIKSCLWLILIFLMKFIIINTDFILI